MARQKVNDFFARSSELDNGIRDGLFGGLCDVRGFLAVADMKGIDLPDFKLPGLFRVAVRVDGMELNPGRMIRVTLDKIRNPRVFPPFKKTINLKILLELSDNLGRLRREAEDLGLGEVPPVVVTGIEEVEHDESAHKEEGINC